ncbi:MAG: hypothetical protein VX294_06275 [Candidatus Latescibacterota bacterium]|nr:hypothetical protein [Candidatus Latescibacterota bacterium]
MCKTYMLVVSVGLSCCSQNFTDSDVKGALREFDMTVFDPNAVVETTPELPISESGIITEIDLGGVIGSVPEEWHAVTPSNSMRVAEYHLHGFGGEPDGIIAVFYFGPGQGGGTQANINRWIGQFQSENRPPISRQWNQRVSGMNVERVEISGTYNVGTMSGGNGESLENHLLYGAIVESPYGSFFFKLTGPEIVLKKNKASFERYISSLRPK